MGGDVPAVRRPSFASTSPPGAEADLPFWLFFSAMVGQLLRLAVIKGTDVILDATTLRTWFHDDPDAAWSDRKPGQGAVWGYKMHTVLCRWAQLPLVFVVTPAQRHDSLAAIPILRLAVACFGLQIAIVRIERHFAWAKRYFGLEAARWNGLVAAYQHTALVYSVMLGVALVAHRYQRPELAGSRYRVLALKAVP